MPEISCFQGIPLTCQHASLDTVQRRLFDSVLKNTLGFPHQCGKRFVSFSGDTKPYSLMSAQCEYSSVMARYIHEGLFVPMGWEVTQSAS